MTPTLNIGKLMTNRQRLQRIIEALMCTITKEGKWEGELHNKGPQAKEICQLTTIKFMCLI